MAQKVTKKATGVESDLGKQVAKLNNQVKLLQEKIDAQSGQIPAKPVLYPKLPAWVIVREYLISVGGTDDANAIVKALLAAGHSLGKYPLRTVMNTALSAKLPGMFSVDRQDSAVYVTVNPSYFYKPSRHRGGAASSGKPSLVKRAPASKR